ncbi:MAG: hypothetical protein MI864_17625 [Pseudomonadales bacterium]|nr:hypothetical protein [Pseudomonadales bacterium]
MNNSISQGKSETIGSMPQESITLLSRVDIRLPCLLFSVLLIVNLLAQ